MVSALPMIFLFFCKKIIGKALVSFITSGLGVNHEVIAWLAAGI